MEKRKLSVEELRVEAFETAAVGAWIGGTVLDDEATLICSEKRSCGHVCP